VTRRGYIQGLRLVSFHGVFGKPTCEANIVYGLAGNLTCHIVELSAKRLHTTTIHPIVSGTPRFQVGENRLEKD